MATISSTGIGSGLDVNSIVSQLVALEKTPLKTLALKATNVQAQISAFGEIQSQFAALTDVASRISVARTWGARNASSSNASAATITAAPTANATSFTLDVDQLAQSQSVSSAAVAPGTKPGAGTLTLQLGKWSAGGGSFTPGAAASVDVTVLENDSIAAIAAKINGANAGVVATVFNDGTNERLMLSSKTTGEATGFRVQARAVPVDPETVGVPITDNSGLGQLAFDPPENSFGMASAAIPKQYGQDAKARINGLAVTSATNTLTDNIPGVTVKLVATTTKGYGTFLADGTTSAEVKSPITMGISEDVTPAVKNVSDFVTAYNTLNKSLADLTKYDATTKTAGLFQGDSLVVGLQNILRNMLGSASLGATSQRLSDVGIERQKDGSLTINTAKLSVAANNGTTLQQLFTNNNNNPLTNGFALKFRDLGKGVAASGGWLLSKVAALKNNLDTNAKEQTKVNDRAALFETRLRKQYSALDAQMAQLNALNAYVTQQVAAWNKSTA
ncbi:MAG: flagellar filament capping protein FliD [Gammaproteobacteria bacterium]|uniref:flagellar filament capping protein FliD n=1 Tax=Rhodoferax sp. TaxID=50421 RepID=UPI001D1F0380|nr:flagellar filament capping protein FliD [Rhodoferax sp.]MBU3897666.1 flagellar filament capping protein FliD [Gammaproteobacteria bacterium]MBU3998575.1 flagellar filament capping protein FliD [Gammaproteobacteria bacterium]MBU4080042.1 flagellar filament capping protein FliD [Gammaproteobacteria bacterium]MBU4112161.1 flagellar filament capping protein FliD [Gammaproteobacteria bacterium]MBU4172320.1 flagellar filament capping protein FliD [Gammaproteobacteria bacterium]